MWSICSCWSCCSLVTCRWICANFSKQGSFESWFERTRARMNERPLQRQFALVRKCHFRKSGIETGNLSICPEESCRTRVNRLIENSLPMKLHWISSRSCTPSIESESIRTMARGYASSSRSIIRRSNGTIRWSKEDEHADDINEKCFKLWRGFEKKEGYLWRAFFSLPLSLWSTENETSRFLSLSRRLTNFFDCNRHCWQGVKRYVYQTDTEGEWKDVLWDFQIGQDSRLTVRHWEFDLTTSWSVIRGTKMKVG